MSTCLVFDVSCRPRAVAGRHGRRFLLRNVRLTCIRMHALAQVDSATIVKTFNSRGGSHSGDKSELQHPAVHVVKQKMQGFASDCLP